jgi:hypothetical protein
MQVMQHLHSPRVTKLQMTIIDPLAENQDELESFLYDDGGPIINDLSELDKYMVEPL